MTRLFGSRSRARRRGPGSILAVVVLAVTMIGVLAACQTPSTRPPRPRPLLPCDEPGDDVVVIAGDSVTGGWSTYLVLPEGTTILNLSRGGSSYSAAESDDISKTMSIPQRLLAQLDVCGNDVGLVVISGGVNDLAQGQSTDAIESAVTELSAELDARGVASTWVPILPWPLTGEFTAEDERFINRAAYNDWLRQPGQVGGPVLECNGSVDLDGAPVEQLAPEYQKIDGTTVDIWHPNPFGSSTFAGCIDDQITAHLP